jgi:hypothetical protein
MSETKRYLLDYMEEFNLTTEQAITRMSEAYMDNLVDRAKRKEAIKEREEELFGKETNDN